MEKTKIYLVTRTFLGAFVGNTDVVGFTFSKLDAEHEVWKRKNDKNKYTYYHYYVEEASYLEVTKDKNYGGFLEERRKEIKEKIKKVSECKEKDLVSIAKFEKELEELNSIKY